MTCLIGHLHGTSFYYYDQNPLSFAFLWKSGLLLARLAGSMLKTYEWKAQNDVIVQMSYSHVMLNNIEWGEGGKRTFMRATVSVCFRITGKNSFFEMCFNRFCARLHVVQFDLIKSKKPYIFTILENLSVKTKTISRQTPSGHNAYDKKGEINRLQR